jgi:aminoglycoside 6'-N-acetyltransferase I
LNAEIRIAKADDWQDWARLRHQLWPTCPPERHRLEIEQLLAGSGIVAVASVRGNLAGFVEISVRTDHVEGTTSVPVPYLEGWFVGERFRGQGIGRALLAFAERWAVEHGHRELASDAEIENEAAVRLHGRAGCREVGRSVHFVKPLARS